MTALLKKVEEWTQDDFNAWLGDQSTLGGVIDKVSGELAEMRARVERGETAFTADDIVVALNFVEQDRVLAHFLFDCLNLNIAKMRAKFERVGCWFCDWMHVSPTIPAHREMTEDEVLGLEAAHREAVTRHILECPNHPMRALETKLANLTAGSWKKLAMQAMRFLNAEQIRTVAERAGAPVNICTTREEIETAIALGEQVGTPDPYEYRVTSGQRKAWDGEPDLTKEGWELDPYRGVNGQSWERFDYHEEMYWRRLKQPGESPEDLATTLRDVDADIDAAREHLDIMGSAE